MKKHLPVYVLLLFALVLAACGGGDSEEAGGGESAGTSTTIQVVENDIYFGDTNDNASNPPTWTVSAGREVTANIANNGALEHNFGIVEKGATLPEPFVEAENSDVILLDSGLTSPGEEVTFTFTAPSDPGEYQVICTVPGHYPLMQGILIVE